MESLPRRMLIGVTLFSALAATIAASVESADDRAAKLTVGVVQLSREPELAMNRDKIVRFIGEARSKGCRVVVFPESALSWSPGTTKAEIDAAIAVIRKAAKANDVYVIFCAIYKRTEKDKPFNWLLVIDPEGRVIQRYHKLWYDRRSNEVPGIFHIDGIPCSAIICADRWIRGVEDLPAIGGSKILFELSDNFADEWVPDLGWFWYVPRALRNGVYVVFANTAPNPKKDKTQELGNKHGHSAVIAPDGRFVVAAGVEPDRLLVAKIDVASASGTEAMRRRNHPLFKPFWDVGQKAMDGGSIDVSPFNVQNSPKARVKIAAAQLACSRNVADNVARMKRMVREAASNGADAVVFPELAVTGAEQDDVADADQATLDEALREIQAAARAAEIHVIFGMPHLDGGKRHNCVLVLSPEGVLLTRYAQVVVDRPNLFDPGSSTRSMWFRLKGVPSVVTIGRREALWSEIAELAAVRGAQMHFHLRYDRDASTRGTLLRKQLWVNMASFRTFTATVNAASPDGLSQPSSNANGGSIIWEDFRRSRKRGPSGYGSYSAVPLAKAGTGEQIIYATQVVDAKNPRFRIMTDKTNPQMQDWYEMGARVIDADKPLTGTTASDLP